MLTIHPISCLFMFPVFASGNTLLKREHFVDGEAVKQNATKQLKVHCHIMCSKSIFKSYRHVGGKFVVVEGKSILNFYLCSVNLCNQIPGTFGLY